MLRSRVSVAILGAALVATACRDVPLTPSDNEVTGPSLSQSGASQGSESIQDRLASAVPGFGGFFFDNAGQPTAFLTDAANRGEAMRTLNAELRAMGLTRSDVRVLPAAHLWTDLARWHDAGTDAALSIDGVVWTDADESTNSVRVGVSDLAAMGLVRSELSRLGIPASAVEVQRAEPIVQVATLRDVIRPVQAGVQINFPGFLCSVGFNATLNGQASFVTASHCTTTQGGVEGTPYWQPLQSLAPTQIATEVADPVYTRRTLPGCPGGRRCRYSDAARAAYAVASNMALGVIAKTTGANNGSLTLNGTFNITADDCNTLGGCLAVGTQVAKVGRTTGWTQGNITNTCVNTGVSGSNIVQLCQTFVSAGVGGGDSGSDVIQILSGTSVKLAGVLWGGSSSGAQFVYSPLGNVKRELGALVTH